MLLLAQSLTLDADYWREETPLRDPSGAPGEPVNASPGVPSGGFDKLLTCDETDDIKRDPPPSCLVRRCLAQFLDAICCVSMPLIPQSTIGLPRDSIPASARHEPDKPKWLRASHLRATIP